MDTSDMRVKSSSSSTSITLMDTASDMTVKSTDRRYYIKKTKLIEKSCKNICMAKYSY